MNPYLFSGIFAVLGAILLIFASNPLANAINISSWIVSIALGVIYFLGGIALWEFVLKKIGKKEKSEK